MILLPVELILIIPDSSLQGLIGPYAVWLHKVCRVRDGNLEHVLQQRISEFVISELNASSADSNSDSSQLQSLTLIS